ncbi:hypothetical protein B2G69_13830 [Methylorubrum zatmanii]|nr:ADP-ribosylglycohydrolase family protein [Methylorubrum zatmanii]ARO55093.1 hypothetical protein B2G69_13830 [Methylorubrum zatmanii]
MLHSLEAALWCVGSSGSFSEAVLKAVNLGDDADTTGAIAGQLAGAFYGLSGIPERWPKRLVWNDQIAGLPDRPFTESVRLVTIRSYHMRQSKFERPFLQTLIQGLSKV